MQYELVKRLPKERVIGVGGLNIYKSGEAMFFEDNGELGFKILAEMQRVKIDWAAYDGILISGFEQTFSKANQTVWLYQEWYLRYIKGVK